MTTITLTFLQTAHYFCHGAREILPLSIEGRLEQSGCERCPVFSSCHMSHWTAVQTKITDTEALRNAAQELGLSMVEGIPARGYAGQVLKCAYTIQLKTPSPYDVAVTRAKDGTYSLQTDWYEGHVEKQVGPNFGLLMQRYGVHKAAMAARAKGYTVQRSTKANGSIQLTITTN